MTREELDQAIANGYQRWLTKIGSNNQSFGNSTVAERIAFVAGIRTAAELFDVWYYGSPKQILIDLADEAEKEI